MATIAASAPRAGTPITNKTLIGRFFLVIFNLEILLNKLLCLLHQHLILLFLLTIYANYLSSYFVYRAETLTPRCPEVMQEIHL